MNNRKFPALHFKFDYFFVEITVFSYQFCTLGLFVTSNVVKLMFISLFKFNESHHDGD